MKKSVLFVIPFILNLFSCSNFLDGDSLNGQIQDAIKQASAPKTSVMIDIGRTDYGKIIPNQEVIFSVGTPVEVQFYVTYNFDFNNMWKVVDRKTEKALAADKYFTFKQVKSFNEGTATIYTTEITMLQKRDNLLIRPVCGLKSDTFAPEILDFKLYKSEKAVESNSFLPKAIDPVEVVYGVSMDGDYTYRTGQLFLNLTVKEGDSEEITLFVKEHTYIPETGTYLEDVKEFEIPCSYFEKQGEDKFVVSDQENGSCYKYQFVTDKDNCLKLEFYVKDASGNISVPQEYIIYKDTNVECVDTVMFKDDALNDYSNEGNNAVFMDVGSAFLNSMSEEEFIEAFTSYKAAVETSSLLGETETSLSIIRDKISYSYEISSNGKDYSPLQFSSIDRDLEHNDLYNAEIKFGYFSLKEMNRNSGIYIRITSADQAENTSTVVKYIPPALRFDSFDYDSTDLYLYGVNRDEALLSASDFLVFKTQDSDIYVSSRCESEPAFSLEYKDIKLLDLETYGLNTASDVITGYNISRSRDGKVTSLLGNKFSFRLSDYETTASSSAIKDLLFKMSPSGIDIDKNNYGNTHVSLELSRDNPEFFNLHISIDDSLYEQFDNWTVFYGESSIKYKCEKKTDILNLMAQNFEDDSKIHIFAENKSNHKIGYYGIACARSIPSELLSLGSMGVNFSKFDVPDVFAPEVTDISRGKLGNILEFTLKDSSGFYSEDGGAVFNCLVYYSLRLKTDLKNR